MIRLSTVEAAGVIGGVWQGPAVALAGVFSDTRKVLPGALFVALTGPRFDGHDFVAPALAAGAAAAVIKRAERARFQGLPVIAVDDPRRALGALAAYWRRRMSATVLAITGSNGKTTVKAMLTAILRQSDSVLATPGNWNNDIGLPLTLCGLTPTHRFAVIEMGANHAGEIAGLTAIAAPDVGLVNNAGPAHLEGFGSLDGVADAKGELYAGLPERSVAVINADDAYAEQWRAGAGQRRIVSFSARGRADCAVTGHAPAAPAQPLMLTIAGDPWWVALRYPGRHNVMNALAAAAMAHAVGVPGERIARGLAAATPVDGRLSRRPGPAGAQIYDDSYNANPASVQAGMVTLRALPGETWVVLGDMAELGEAAEYWHRVLGRFARQQGVARLFTIGALSRLAAAAFGDGAQHFERRDALIAALRSQLGAGVNCLIKGSRSAGMERVVEALTAAAAEGGTDAG